MVEAWAYNGSSGSRNRLNHVTKDPSYSAMEFGLQLVITVEAVRG